MPSEFKFEISGYLDVLDHDERLRLNERIWGHAEWGDIKKEKVEIWNGVHQYLIQEVLNELFLQWSRRQ